MSQQEETKVSLRPGVNQKCQEFFDKMKDRKTGIKLSQKLPCEELLVPFCTILKFYSTSFIEYHHY